MIYSGLEEFSDLLIQIIISRGLNIHRRYIKGAWAQVAPNSEDTWQAVRLFQPEITGGHTGNILCFCSSSKYIEAVNEMITEGTDFKLWSGAGDQATHLSTSGRSLRSVSCSLYHYSVPRAEYASVRYRSKSAFHLQSPGVLFQSPGKKRSDITASSSGDRQKSSSRSDEQAEPQPRSTKKRKKSRKADPATQQ